MLILTDRYPLQVDTDPDYPQGKARNRTSPGDGTGTPWEKDLVNEFIGSMQALVAAGGVTPSGTGERVGSSDVVLAISALIGAKLTIDTYSPSYFNLVNIDSFDSVYARYQLVGAGHYRVIYRATVNPVGSGLVSWDMTKPIVGGVTNDHQIVGSGAAREEPAGGIYPVHVIGKLSNGSALCRFMAGSSNSHTVSLSWDYYA